MASRGPHSCVVMLQDKTKPFIFKHPHLILEVGDAGFVSDDTTVADCRLPIDRSCFGETANCWVVNEFKMVLQRQRKATWVTAQPKMALAKLTLQAPLKFEIIGATQL